MKLYELPDTPRSAGTSDWRTSVDSLTPESMMAVAEANAASKIGKPLQTALALAASAGIFIGLGFIFYVTVTSGPDLLPWGVSRMLGGIAFSLGLILLVVCGGELFTSTVLTSVVWAGGRISVPRMLRHWSVVYFGNAIGALSLVALALVAQLHMQGHGHWGANVLQIAQHKLHHGFVEAAALGFMCNIMVCLAVWMTYSTRRVGEKALLVMLPVALFVSTGFEHIVANMFIVPLGVAIAHTAEAAYWSSIAMQAEQFSDLTWSRFIVSNAIPVTIGNVLGGMAVGLGYWALYGTKKNECAVRDRDNAAQQTAARGAYRSRAG